MSRPPASRSAPASLVAGVDEAGRGPLAGPLVVAAVILDPARPIAGLDDSKRLSPRQRTRLHAQIQDSAVAWQLVIVNCETIDRLNILQATLKGMQQAVERLSPCPGFALVDGNRAPTLPCPARAIVQGDRLEPAISAASILAKVTRDGLMDELHARYPVYGFDRNRGYPTPEHLFRLERYGPCPEHRRSFGPVRVALAQTRLPFCAP